jgi:hypothetical protein
MNARALLIVAVLVGVGGCQRDKIASLNDVPPPVKATFEREAQGGKVTDIFHQKKKGQMVYTADVTDKSGKVWDVHVAEDGRLISKD